jgi:hypothetical protein
VVSGRDVDEVPVVAAGIRPGRHCGGGAVVLSPSPAPAMSVPLEGGEGSMG